MNSDAMQVVAFAQSLCTSCHLTRLTHAKANQQARCPTCAVPLPKEVHLECGLIHLLLRGSPPAENTKGEEAWELQQQCSAPAVLCQDLHHLAKDSKQQEGVVRLDCEVGTIVHRGLLLCG